MEAVELLNDAFVKALGVPVGGNFDLLAYGETGGWDSVAHMALIAAIESNFDIMLATDDVIDMSSYSRAKEIVAKYGGSFA